VIRDDGDSPGFHSKRTHTSSDSHLTTERDYNYLVYGEKGSKIFPVLNAPPDVKNKMSSQYKRKQTKNGILSESSRRPLFRC
jgi:hypothetical protein